MEGKRETSTANASRDARYTRGKGQASYQCSMAMRSLAGFSVAAALPAAFAVAFAAAVAAAGATTSLACLVGATARAASGACMFKSTHRKRSNMYRQHTFYTMQKAGGKGCKSALGVEGAVPCASAAASCRFQSRQSVL